MGFWGRVPKVGGLSGAFGASCGHVGTPSFPRAKHLVCRKWSCRSRTGPDRQEAGWSGGLSYGCCRGASIVIWTVTTSDVSVCLLLPYIWFQNQKARHPQLRPSGPSNGRAQGPGGAETMTTSSPEDRRATLAFQSNSPLLGPSPPQESMPPLVATAAPFGAPTFWVPGTASGICVGQPLMIFVVQPSPVALQPSGKLPPPPQVADPWATCSPAFTAPGQPGQGAILPPGQPEAHIPRWLESPYCEGTATPLEPQLHPAAFQAR